MCAFDVNLALCPQLTACIFMCLCLHLHKPNTMADLPITCLEDLSNLKTVKSQIAIFLHRILVLYSNVRVCVCPSPSIRGEEKDRTEEEGITQPQSLV